MKKVHDHSPSSEERIALAKALFNEFGFSYHQALYLSVQSYGYCDDLLHKYKQIRSDMDRLKDILKGMSVL